MTWKTIASAALASALAVAPLAASAHEHTGSDNGLKLGAFLGTRTDQGLRLGSVLGVRAGDEATATVAVGTKQHGDARHATSSAMVASTTAARITAQATRTIRRADALSAFGTTLQMRLASSSLSASSTAAANARLSDFATQVAGAKTQANAALFVAAQLGSTSATSTVDLAAQARTDLKAANGFLRAALQDLRHIFGLIFRA